MNWPEDLLAVARRVVWFKEPDRALEDQCEFLAHLMTYGTIEDLTVARRYYTDADLIEILDRAPAGVFDARSWAYWNTFFGRIPPPELPRRRLP